MTQICGKQLKYMGKADDFDKRLKYDGIDLEILGDG